MLNSGSYPVTTNFKSAHRHLEDNKEFVQIALKTFQDYWTPLLLMKNRFHNKKQVNISFRQISKIYRGMVKYYALIRLINGVGVYTISCRVRNIAIFLQFLNGAPLSDIDYVTASDFKSGQ